MLESYGNVISKVLISASIAIAVEKTDTALSAGHSNIHPSIMKCSNKFEKSLLEYLFENTCEIENM